MTDPPRATLLHTPDEEDGAAQTFSAVLEQIAAAQDSIAIHMYVWRSDEIGNQVGDALLAAARRGVKIDIIKDPGAKMYERIEMNRKSYFARDVSKRRRLWWRAIRPTFPDTYVEDDFQSGAGRELADHENVTLTWVEGVHTHTKYYLFDKRHLITGSINVEDRHRGYFDYMVHLEADGLGDHFRAREAGTVEPDTTRQVEFIFNQTMHGEHRFEIKPLLIDLFDKAEREVHIEVAYIGDPDIDDAIARAADRGVEVNILLSEKANIGNDNNYRAAEKLFTSAPVNIFLTPKMIHAKMVTFDREIVFSGSANLSIFSMRNSAEFNLLVREPGLVADFLAVADARKAVSREVLSPETLSAYNHTLAVLQEWHQKLKL